MPCNQASRKTALKAKPLASENKLRTSEDVQSTGRKDNVPLKTWKKSSHAVKSLRASRVRRTLWRGLEIPQVRSCKRRKKARPGTMARHANVKKPITDKRSRKQTFFRLDKTCKRCTRGGVSLSVGIANVCAQVSTTMPWSVGAEVGTTVLACFTGRLRERKRIEKASRLN